MSCKVDRAVAAYGLTPTGAFDDLDGELVARWRGAGDREAQGYRSLTEWFNRRLLKQVYDANGRETVGTRVESDYRALRGDDRLLAEEVKDDLRGDGIDADAVADALVSWSTMRHHLKDCLGAEKATGTGSESESPSEWERESVAIAVDRAEEKLADAVRSLSGKGRLAGGAEASLSVEAYLSCPVCGVRRRFADALQRGAVCERHFDARPDGESRSTGAGTDEGGDAPAGRGSSAPGSAAEPGEEPASTSASDPSSEDDAPDGDGA